LPTEERRLFYRKQAKSLGDPMHATISLWGRGNHPSRKGNHPTRVLARAAKVSWNACARKKF
jgi:hypothetical protein